MSIAVRTVPTILGLALALAAALPPCAQAQTLGLMPAMLIDSDVLV